jgi:uncharacterized protein YjbI with pentapeptide repeats
MLSLLVGIASAAAGAAAAQSDFPEVYFRYPLPSGPKVPAIADEKTRAAALAALRSPDRDEQLVALGIRSQWIGGERWFDFRGTAVTKNEITPDANLTTICWDYAYFKDVDLTQANLNRGLFRSARFEDVAFRGANFGSAYMEGAHFKRCPLQGAQFQVAHLGRGSHFSECDLENARFDNCVIDGDIIFSGGSMRAASFANVSLRAAKFVGVNLTGASFSGANLTKADFHGALLSGTDFRRAVLIETKFRSARVEGSLQLGQSLIQHLYLGEFDLEKLDVAHAEWVDGDYTAGEERQADLLLADDGSVVDARQLYAQAEAVYRGLAQQYREAGYVPDYLNLRFRALEAQRKLALVSSTPRPPWQVAWFYISRWVDGYATKPARLAANICLMLLLFSTVYFVGWLRHGRGWFRWYRPAPEGIGFLRGDSAEFVESTDNLTPTAVLQRSGRRRSIGLLKLYLISLGLSIEASFMFAEKMINIPNILGLFRKRDERPVPFGSARHVFALEAVLGLVCFILVGRMIVRDGRWLLNRVRTNEPAKSSPLATSARLC